MIVDVILNDIFNIQMWRLLVKIKD